MPKDANGNEIKAGDKVYCIRCLHPLHASCDARDFRTPGTVTYVWADGLISVAWHGHGKCHKSTYPSSANLELDQVSDPGNQALIDAYAAWVEADVKLQHALDNHEQGAKRRADAAEALRAKHKTESAQEVKQVEEARAHLAETRAKHDAAHKAYFESRRAEGAKS